MSISPDEEMKVSIVIVCWNGYSYVGSCLEGLQKQIFRNLEIIVVDNASQDNSVKYIKENYPEVKVIENDSNVGFARANNIGIANSSGEIIGLLNQDTEVEDNCISECVRFLMTSSITGMCSPKIKYFGTNKIWYAGGLIIAGQKLIRQLSIRPTVHIGKREEDLGGYDNVNETGYGTGCALFVKREVIDNIGLLDEHYFMYFEDADWSVRAIRAGYKIGYVATTTVFHKDNIKGMRKTLKQYVSKYFNYSRSTIRFVSKNYNLKVYRIWLMRLPMVLTYLALWQIFKTVPGLRRSGK